jgi:diadenosine tetraphosphate (Ap4A) HIT family hydrolase
MSSSDPYPQSCPFCAIAASYPAPQSTTADPVHSGSHPNRNEDFTPELLQAVPEQVDSSKIQPNCCLVLSAPHVLAFLDIMPMTRGHLLVVAREHREKIGDVNAVEASDLGKSLALRVLTGLVGFGLRCLLQLMMWSQKILLYQSDVRS